MRKWKDLEMSTARKASEISVNDDKQRFRNLEHTFLGYGENTFSVC